MLFFLVFVVFIAGIIIFLTAKEDELKVEKGKSFLRNSIYGFFVVLIIFIVFLSSIYFLNKREMSIRNIPMKGIPPSPVSANYPPPLKFVKVGKFYFRGPLALKNNNLVSVPILYAVLCKNGEKYDTVYVGGIYNPKKSVDLLKNEEYSCWLNHCEKNSNNLYFAFQFLSNNLKNEQIRDIEKNRKILEVRTNSLCSDLKFSNK